MATWGSSRCIPACNHNHQAGSTGTRGRHDSQAQTPTAAPSSSFGLRVDRWAVEVVWEDAAVDADVRRERNRAVKETVTIETLQAPVTRAGEDDLVSVNATDANVRATSPACEYPLHHRAAFIRAFICSNVSSSRCSRTLNPRRPTPGTLAPELA